MLRGLPSIAILISDNFDFVLGPKIIICVLSILRERRFALSQFTRFGITRLIVVSMFLRLGPDENILESSANIIVEDLSEIEPRSFMYKMKRIGPRMEPCGTPHLISVVDEVCTLYVVNCLRFDR